MQAGRFDQRGVLQRFSVAASSGLNEPIKTWADVATMWCMYEPDAVMSRAAAEEFQAGQERASWDMAKITLRWRSDVTPTTKDRFVVSGKTYDILRVNVTAARQQMFEMTCRAKVDA